MGSLEGGPVAGYSLFLFSSGQELGCQFPIGLDVVAHFPRHWVSDDLPCGPAQFLPPSPRLSYLCCCLPVMSVAVTTSKGSNSFSLVHPGKCIFLSLGKILPPQSHGYVGADLHVGQVAACPPSHPIRSHFAHRASFLDNCGDNSRVLDLLGLLSATLASLQCNPDVYSDGSRLGLPHTYIKPICAADCDGLRYSLFLGT
ncbi:hypothetical protein V8F06_008542 [Rhypophila decipiens]